ncbi:hypothetical protein [Sporohalobacter salinus]|uniref:hypothetical protein n=1 Tax=Sporohalobacter salinus TaxID=1494606 RepID=UPI0019601D41|nr:hypothetical protein [Sporohalobacter salinus]MBM7624794.1 hypothetical protein [Sporohalobacter salinus]
MKRTTELIARTTEQFKNHVEDECRRRGMTQSDLIHCAIEDFFKQDILLPKIELINGEFKQRSKFTKLLFSFDESVVYLFLRKDYSSHYRTVNVVIEDIKTNDYYPFSKQLSFNKPGGGWNNAKRIHDRVQEAKEKDLDVHISVRVIDNDVLSLFLKGNLSWNKLKENSIPAHIVKDEQVKSRYEEFKKEILEEKE